MITDPEVADSTRRRAAVIHLQIPKDQMQKAMGPAIHEVLDAIQSQGIDPAGPVFARHFGLHPDRWGFEVRIPVDAEVEGTGRVTNGKLPEARVARTLYRGPYEGLPDAWRSFHKWVESRDDLEVGEQFRERCLAGPESSAAPKDYRTELTWTLAS